MLEVHKKFFNEFKDVSRNKLVNMNKDFTTLINSNKYDDKHIEELLFFRRKFDEGAYGRSYNPGAGGVVQHGPINTGNGNKNGNQGGGDGPKPHSGPTLAEIEAQKKAAAAAEEARLQALEDARSKQMYENTMAKRKKNIKYYDENLKTKKISPIDS